MMNYVLLIVVVIVVMLQNILNKQFDLKFSNAKNSAHLFNFISAAASLVFVGIFFIFKPEFHLATFLYSLIFAMGLSAALIFAYLAVKNGPLSLSSLFFSFSLIIPSLYGVVFLKETLSIVGIIGLVCLALSIILTARNGKGGKISKKWFLYVILSFIGNGLGSTVQKMHQTNFPGEYSISFMFFGSIFVALICLVVFLFNRPPNIKQILKSGGLIAILKGLCIALTNILVLNLASKLPATVLFPVVTAGGIVLTFIFAIFYYKEKLNVIQYIGYALGLLSIVLLQI